MTDGFASFVSALSRANARFVLIGVAGANYYAAQGDMIFATQDRDLFIPPDSANTKTIWQVATSEGLELRSSGAPLDQPRDEWLAKRIIERSASFQALGDDGLQVDLTFVMAGFVFDTVWAERREFRVGDVSIPVARLSQIVASKRQADRPKDRLFLTTFEARLQELLNSDADS